MTMTLNLKGSERNLKVIKDLLEHIQYLGIVGASRNLLVRVDGDGSGQVYIVDKDGEMVDSPEEMGRKMRSVNIDYLPEWQDGVVGVYDLE